MASSIYTDFSQCQSYMLSITRNGFWRPEYVLTDGQFCYGKLSSVGTMRREMTIETADGSWMIKPLSLLGRETLIFDTSSSENIGKTIRQKWNNSVDLEMANGFNVVLHKKGIFSRSFYWSDNNFLDFIIIRGQFKYSIPFTVMIDQRAINSKINISLMALLGLQIILLKQSQAAAH